MNQMMKCGHAANATWKSPDGDKPCCVICMGVDEGATVVDNNPPDLTGRLATCSYHSHSPVPSSSKLAFFEHQPDKPFDRYYCGCYGWD